MSDKESFPADNIKNEKENYLLNLIVKIDSRIKRLEKLSKNFSNFRLLLFVSAIVDFIIYYFVISTPALLFILSILFTGFLIAVHYHNRIDQAGKKTAYWKEIKSNHLSKIRLEWKNIQSIDYKDYEIDPTEADLNICGNQSLHQLINTASTKQGKRILRKYLYPVEPDLDEILQRQELVKELIPLHRFRDKVSLISLFPSKKELDGSLLLEWVKKENYNNRDKIYLIILGILAPVNIIFILLSYFSGLYPVWIFTLFVYASIFFSGNKKKNKTHSEFEFLNDELSKFGTVLEYIEKYPFKNNSKLKKLCECYTGVELKPSELMKKINNAYQVQNLKKGNPLIWNTIRLFFPIDFYYNHKLMKYKKIISGYLEQWLETLYRIEALNSLANFAWLNPDYKFPIIVVNRKFEFNAVKLGHPFIPSEKKICNDFKIEPESIINLITGSNMSGKSTFLRTMGINLCLAYAGAPVNAERLDCSLFRIFSCIKVSDSVVDGISYFYAEVKRLKSLLDEAREKSDLPLFFLIDEIFRGTNNIERLKGSTAFVKALSSLNVAGALATHDLELVKLEPMIKIMKNYHFKEKITDGRMTFDYKIQPGPCPTTNALKIMALEGLPVEN